MCDSYELVKRENYTQSVEGSEREGVRERGNASGRVGLGRCVYATFARVKLQQQMETNACVCVCVCDR